MFKRKGSFTPVDNEFDFSESDFECDCYVLGFIHIGFISVSYCTLH